MPSPKFTALPHPKASDKRSLNNKNGSDSEVFAGAYLIMATGGEISWGSREEDGNKIDLLLSFPNQWGIRGRKIVLAQVKSGPSYGKVDTKNGVIKAELLKKIFEDSFTETNDILLLWIERKKNRCFWTYVNRGDKPAKRPLAATQLISPALRYDLARIIGSREKHGGQGLIFSTEETDFRSKRTTAQRFYREYASQMIISPLLGQIKVTKSGWRHMSRASRRSGFKQSSYEIMQWLPQIIERAPDYHETQSSNIYPTDVWTYRDSIYMLVYQKVKRHALPKPELTTVYIKIEESIVYPTNWHQTVQRLQLVERHCKLLSVYYHLGQQKRGKHVAS